MKTIFGATSFPGRPLCPRSSGVQGSPMTGGPSGRGERINVHTPLMCYFPGATLWDQTCTAAFPPRRQHAPEFHPDNDSPAPCCRFLCNCADSTGNIARHSCSTRRWSRRLLVDDPACSGRSSCGLVFYEGQEPHLKGLPGRTYLARLDELARATPLGVRAAP